MSELYRAMTKMDVVSFQNLEDKKWMNIINLTSNFFFMQYFLTFLCHLQAKSIIRNSLKIFYRTRSRASITTMECKSITINYKYTNIYIMFTRSSCSINTRTILQFYHTIQCCVSKLIFFVFYTKLYDKTFKNLF